MVTQRNRGIDTVSRRDDSTYTSSAPSPSIFSLANHLTMSSPNVNTVWDMPVREVRFTIHNTGAHERGMLSENHLTTYLCCDNGLSVQLNMKTDGEHIDGSLIMQPKTYQQSRSEITSIKITTTASFTPRDVCQLIRSRKLDEYTFTNGGIGCRFYG